MTYRLVKITTKFTVAGGVHSKQQEVLRTTTNLREAFAAEVAAGPTTWPEPDLMVSHRVQDVQTGSQILLDVLYEQEVGPETFAAQLADDNFFIDLDKWFRESLKPVVV